MRLSCETSGWVGKVVVCNVCGRGWTLEVDDPIETVKDGHRHRVGQLYAKQINLDCGHTWKTRRLGDFDSPLLKGRFDP